MTIIYFTFMRKKKGAETSRPEGFGLMRFNTVTKFNELTKSQIAKREWYLRNKDRPGFKERKREILREYRRRLRSEAIAILGGKCAWVDPDTGVMCGIDDVRILHIDHINGGGNEERRLLKNEGYKLHKKVIECKGEGYQCLCPNHNWLKRYLNGEV